MIYSTKQEAETAALHANLGIDTTYKRWVVEKCPGGWQLVLEYQPAVVASKRSHKYLIIAGILFFLTYKYL